MWKEIFAILCYVCCVFAEKSRVCYFRNKSYKGRGKAKFTPENVDPYLCTEINYAFLQINMQTSKVGMTLREDADILARLNALKQVNPALKVTIAIGGWNHEKKPRFSNMVHTREQRLIFINSLVAFLKKHDLDGVSLDWMYPGIRPKNTPPTDKFCFTKLLKECASAFKDEYAKSGKRFSLTASVGATKSKINAGYQVNKMAMYLDRVDVMAHSLWGPWKKERITGSPTAIAGNTPTVTNVINLWLSAGMPAHKINMVITSFGRSFNLVDPKINGLGAPFKGPGKPGEYTNGKGMMSYYEICSTKWNKTTGTYQSKTLTPYASKDNLWIAYDDEESIKYKIENVVRKMDLNGITFWSLDWDDFSGDCGKGKFPLLKAAVDALAPPETNDCSVNPCSNNGECKLLKYGFSCKCKNGFAGNLCESQDFCIDSPCLNNGTCVNVRDGFKCVCQKQYQGKTCNQCAKDHAICDMFDDPTYYCSHSWMIRNCAIYCSVCKPGKVAIVDVKKNDDKTDNMTLQKSGDKKSDEAMEIDDDEKEKKNMSMKDM